MTRGIDEIRSLKTMSSTIGADTRESIGDETIFRDVNMKLNGFGAELENLKNEIGRWLKEF